MIPIDGRFGEGGGQILRTSLALSMVTGKAFSMENVRANRRRPGLMRQHLAALNAATAVSGAEADGAALGSTAVAFRPGPVRPGEYRFAVGTAGSATLVLQTVLPALILADGPSRITLEGGTHNPHAPPFEFLERAFLPLVNRMGPRVSAALDRHGFFPAGGGRFRVSVAPAPFLSRAEILHRGEIRDLRARAVVSRLSPKIARREIRVVGEMLGLAPDRLETVEIADSAGPGNVLLVTVESDTAAEVFTGFGERGVRAEKVAERTARAVRAYLESGVPVGPHLADQLLVPMALAGGGSFRTLAPTPHTGTNIAVIRRFLDVDIDAAETGDGSWEIRVGPGASGGPAPRD